MAACTPVNVAALPKIELHVHLDGSFDTQVLFEQAQKKIDTLPPSIAEAVRACGDDVDEFRKLVTCIGLEEKTLQVHHPQKLAPATTFATLPARVRADAGRRR